MCALTRWGCSSGSAMPRTDVFPYTRQEKWLTTVFRRSFFTQGLKNVCVALKWSKWAFEWLREDLDWKPVDRNDRMLLRLKVYRFLFLPYINNTLHRSLFPHRFYFSFLILRNTYRYCCLAKEYWLRSEFPSPTLRLYSISIIPYIDAKTFCFSFCPRFQRERKKEKN